MNINQLSFSPINIKQNHSLLFFENEPYNKLAGFIFNGSNSISSVIDMTHNLSSDCLTDYYINDDSLMLHQVSGQVFCSDINGSHFEGGFYQGAYKLHDYDYQMLPSRFLNGVSFEFLINLSGQTCSESLNDFFPDNEGFIFYYGLKQENPYRGISGDIYSCSGEKYFDNIIDETVYPWVENNPFLVYNDLFICDPPLINYDYKVKYNLDDIINNALGVRITNEGQINIRYISSTGECESSGYEVKNHYSDNIIPLNEITHVLFNFVPLKKYDICDVELPIQTMKFEVWVNGYLKYGVLIPELYSKALDMQKEFQIGIPYNLSIGGGTLGNLENIYPKKINSNFCEYDICVSQNISNLTEIILSGQTQTVNIPITDLEEYIQNNFDLNFKFQSKYNGGCSFYYGTIKTESKLLKFIFGEDTFDFTAKSCYNIIYEDDLDLLALNFAGTFIGNIYCANIYSPYLTVNQIRELRDNNCLDINLKNKCCI